MSKEIDDELYPQWVTLKFHENEGFREFQIDRKSLISRESSILSKYFLEDKEAKIKLSKWIKKESDHEFYVRRSAVLCKYLLNILKGQKTYVPNHHIPKFEEESKLFGIQLTKHIEGDETLYS